jgi:hypothetical protein
MAGFLQDGPASQVVNAKMDTSIEAWCNGGVHFRPGSAFAKTIHGLLTWRETGGDNRGMREVL